MKSLDELKFQDDLRYAQDHEWARQEGKRIRVGVSDYAQDQLGDIVYAELPEIGTTFAVNESFGTLESTKAVSELYIPVAGKVVAINEGLEDAPETVNKDPYGEGWLILVEPSKPADFGALMDKAAYIEMLKGL